MSKDGKIFTLILAVLVLIFCSLSFGAYYFLQKERQEKITLQQQLEETKRQETETRAKLEDSKKMVASLDSKLQAAQSEVEQLTKTIEQEKGVRQEALNQVGQLRAQLDKQKQEQMDLDKMYSQSQGEMSTLQSKLQEIESKKLALETKVKELEEQSRKVELGKIVVSPESTLTAAQASAAGSGSVLMQQPSGQGLQGKVLVINKDYNFVVTNLGKKDGIGIGDTFSVYHGENYIGDVKIEKIHDSMSAAGFISQDTKDKVNEGDKVVQKGK